MDIKVGPITYDHEADEEKIAREKAKSPSLTEVGFQIVGIRVSVDCDSTYTLHCLTYYELCIIIIHAGDRRRSNAVHTCGAEIK